MKILVDIEKYAEQMDGFHSVSEIETEIRIMKATNDSKPCIWQQDLDQDFMEQTLNQKISNILGHLYFARASWHQNRYDEVLEKIDDAIRAIEGEERLKK